MSIINAKDALIRHLLTIPAPNDWPCAYENIEFNPTQGTPWMRATMLFRGPEQMGFGAQCVEEWKGTLQVSCFMPRGESADAALQQFEALRQHFPRSKQLTDDGFTVTILGVKHHTGMNEPQWYHLPVDIEWQAHTYSVLP